MLEKGLLWEMKLLGGDKTTSVTLDNALLLLKVFSFNVCFKVTFFASDTKYCIFSKFNVSTWSIFIIFWQTCF